MIDISRKAFSGLAYLGQAIGPQWDPTIRTWIIMGKYDLELSCALFYQKNGFNRSDATELEVMEESQEALKRMKNWLRDLLQNAINAEMRQMELEMKQNFANLVAQQKEAQKPHAAGTVSEIAAKFGISKSEVRRLKADGKLDEFIQQRQQTA